MKDRGAACFGYFTSLNYLKVNCYVELSWNCDRCNNRETKPRYSCKELISDTKLCKTLSEHAIDLQH